MILVKMYKMKILCEMMHIKFIQAVEFCNRVFLFNFFFIKFSLKCYFVTIFAALCGTGKYGRILVKRKKIMLTYLRYNFHTSQPNIILKKSFFPQSFRSTYCSISLVSRNPSNEISNLSISAF